MQPITYIVECADGTIIGPFATAEEAAMYAINRNGGAPFTVQELSAP